MPQPVIYLENLRKTYLVPERDAGVMAAAKSLIKRRQREIKAVDGVSFAVEPGEIVGFLGPNRAGKTTTLKMLAGLLHPRRVWGGCWTTSPGNATVTFSRQLRWSWASATSSTGIFPPAIRLS